MAERSEDWMAQARHDLENAGWSREGGYHEWACFAAQQAAEKAVKAVVQKLGGDSWGHSVASLLEGLSSREAVEDEIRRCGRLLDRFYVPARYPSGWESGAPKDYYEEEDAREALACAERILRFCQDLLARS